MGKHEERALFLENAELRRRLRTTEIERDVAYENALGKIVDEMVVYSISQPILSKSSVSVGDLMFPQTFTREGTLRWKEKEGTSGRKYKICIMEC